MTDPNPPSTRLVTIARLLQAALLLSILSNLVKVPAFLFVTRHELVVSMFAFSALALAFSTVLAGVLWMVWQYQLIARTRARGIEIGVTPGMSVVWWWVCFANFYMPYKIFRDLDHALSGEFGRSNTLIQSWWFCWILSTLLGRTIDVALTPLSVVASLMTVTSAMLAMYVVGHFTQLAEVSEMGAAPQTF